MHHFSLVVPAQAGTQRCFDSLNFVDCASLDSRLRGNDKDVGHGIYRYSHSAMQYYVYILASQRNGTLYIGVTRDLIKRTWEHKSDVVESFTSRYAVHLIVWYEIHASIDTAITREKQLKKWNRDWKLRLIEESNPTWQDLSLEFTA